MEIVDALKILLEVKIAKKYTTHLLLIVISEKKLSIKSYCYAFHYKTTLVIPLFVKINIHL